VSDESANRAEKKSFRAVIVSALVFAIPMTLYLGATSGRWPLAIALGGGAGALFAAIMGLFVSRAARGDPALFGHVEGIPAEETLLREGPANHFRGVEGVGGKLYLTKKRLRFVAHKLNIQVHDTSWPLDEIERVEPVRTLFVIPNGLRLEHHGKRERFVVYENRAWAEAIESARAALTKREADGR
jgi:hypothetical protein